MSLVLDSSATLAWIYDDEQGDIPQRIFEQVVALGAWVPSLWRLEVANGLRMGLRRGRIDIPDRNAALADLATLKITVDQETDRHAWSTTLELAERFELTLYDAAYLELARRRALPLASLDGPLCNAARMLGVAVLAD
jgi:predicted nucleic acid-binding protein